MVYNNGHFVAGNIKIPHEFYHTYMQRERGDGKERYRGEGGGRVVRLRERQESRRERRKFWLQELGIIITYMYSKVMQLLY